MAKWKQRSKRGVQSVTAALAIAGLSAVAPQGATADASLTTTEPRPELVGDFVVHYEHDEPLQDATFDVIQGRTMPDGGCLFGGVDTATLSGGDSSHIERMREVSYDPESCRSVIEVGRPTAGMVDEGPISPILDPEAGTEVNGDESGLLDRERDALSSPQDLVNEVLSGEVIGTFRAWQRLWYEEPAQQSVGEVTNQVTWSPSRTCASPTAGQDSASYRLDWLEQTGWRLINHDWVTGFTCERVLSQSSVHYKNQLFCATFDTDVHYDVSRTEGRPSGVAAWTWSARKHGGCSILLNFHRDRQVQRIS